MGGLASLEASKVSGHNCRWHLDCTPEEAVDKLVGAINKAGENTDQDYQIHEVHQNCTQTYTNILFVLNFCSTLIGKLDYFYFMKF
jgi:hypothetical protein